MSRAALAPLIGPEFGPFLFASIGEDRNGKLLSVLSMLARLDIDPWQEAASLARMSKETATARLTALIGALPDEPTADVPIASVAGDLVALLPRAISFAPPLPQKLAAPLGFANPRLRLGLCALALLIFLALLFPFGPTLLTGKGAAPPASVETEAVKPARNASDP
jgi:hypothetical protein